MIQKLLDPLGLFTPQQPQGAQGASGASGASGAGGEGAPQDPLSAALALPAKIHQAVTGIVGGVLGNL